MEGDISFNKDQGFSIFIAVSYLWSMGNVHLRKDFAFSVAAAILYLNEQCCRLTLYQVICIMYVSV